MKLEYIVSSNLSQRDKDKRRFLFHSSVIHRGRKTSKQTTLNDDNPLAFDYRMRLSAAKGEGRGRLRVKWDSGGGFQILMGQRAVTLYIKPINGSLVRHRVEGAILHVADPDSILCHPTWSLKLF